MLARARPESSPGSPLPPRYAFPIEVIFARLSQHDLVRSDENHIALCPVFAGAVQMPTVGFNNLTV